MVLKASAENAQLLHLVGGQLAALQLVAEIKKAVGGFAGSVAF